MAGTNISRANGSGSATNKFTLSMWVKRGQTDQGRMFSATGGSGDVYFRFNSGGFIEWSGHGSNASSAGYFITNRTFRDYSSWYHFVIRFDSTQSSASDRLRFYVNGVQEESFSSYTDVNQNATDNISLSSNTHYWGGTVSSQYFDGMMTHMHYSNGYSYGPDTFGETDTTSGTWKPKLTPSVTYGSQGYFLKFENSGAMGTDSSGNSNTFTVANGTLTQSIDTPSNNFCILSPVNYSTNQMTLSNCNTTGTAAGADWENGAGSLGISAGKFYWEYKVVTYTSSDGIQNYGIANVENRYLNDDSSPQEFNTSSTGSTGNYGYATDGRLLVDGSTTSSWGATFGAGDIIGVALDMDNQKLYFSKNGTFQNSGVPTSGSTGTGAISVVAGNTYVPCMAFYGSQAANCNFGEGFFGTTAVTSAGANASGNGVFEYDVPTGYTALSTKGLNS